MLTSYPNTQRTTFSRSDFLNILEEVIPQDDNVVVIYSGIWTFAHLFKVDPLKVSDYILDCIEYYIGKEKTLILPAFCASDFVRTKIFDIKRSLPRESGLLSISALKRKEFARTHNPMHSYLVKGPLQKDVLNLHSTTSWGDDSILSWMVDVNARICPMGLDWNSACSPFHRVEEIFQVPYRYYKKFNGTMYNDGVFVRKCSEIKYSYPLNNILDLDYSIVIPTLRDGYKISESSDSRILMQSSSAKDILSATQEILNNDIYAYVKNKHDAINWVEKFKNAEIESLAEDEIYNTVDKGNHT